VVHIDLDAFSFHIGKELAEGLPVLLVELPHIVQSFVRGGSLNIEVVFQRLPQKKCRLAVEDGVLHPFKNEFGGGVHREHRRELEAFTLLSRSQSLLTLEELV